nr:S9 family peptidase [Haladaptatus pallidirubidus]
MSTHIPSVSDPLTPPNLYDLRRPSDVAVSPDGDYMAFIVTESDPDEDEYRRSLFVASTDGNREPHRLTRVADATSPKWAPNGDRLAFLATRERDVALIVGRNSDAEYDENADNAEDAVNRLENEEPKSQIWTFDLDMGGDARQVTAFEEGVREFDWSPTGDRFVVSARDPTDAQQVYLDGLREDNEPYEITRLQHKQDGAGFLDDVTTYLFVVESDVQGATRGEVTRLDNAYGQGAYEPRVGLQPTWGSRDQIAYVAYYGENPEETYALDVHTIASDGSNRQTLTDGDVIAQGLRWSLDGALLSYCVRHPANFYRPMEIHVADVESHETRSVSESLDRTVSWNGTAEWIADDTLLVPIGDKACTRLVRLDANQDAPERVFASQSSDRTITSFDASPNTTGIVLSHPHEGLDVFTIETTDIDQDVEPTRLTKLNDDLLTDTSLPLCERVRFENTNGNEVEGLVYLPEQVDQENDASPALPLICHIHGGPTVYDAPSFNFEYAYWTGQGYAVLNVNYRGSTSYGRTFSESIRGDWGPREADDIISGVDNLIDRGWVDPTRLFVSGLSQGGINTLHVVTRDDRFAAAAPEHGIYDFYSYFGTGDMHQWYVNDIGVPWENEEIYQTMSSLREIDQVGTPLLITAGENDSRTPPSQAEQLYISAKRAGVEAKLIVYQDEHHNISRPGRAIHRLESLTEWFESHDPGVETSDRTS